MKVAVFDTHRFERPILESVNQRFAHKLVFFEPRLSEETAPLAAGFPAICPFVNDCLNEKVLTRLRQLSVELIALRSAGFNHVDLAAADRLGLKVARVPAYSPHAVAEHAVALILTLNRKVHRAYSRVRELNFSLDGLVGFDLHGKTAGIIGTGKIGTVMAQILSGFGCNVLAYDKMANSDLVADYGVTYTSLEELYRLADIVSLHVPLTRETRHLIDSNALSQMKAGVMLINTGRGALVETKALVASLKSGHIGYAGLDVYEEEENVFFQDLSDRGLQDDLLARLLTFPNVLITSHQAFLTREALTHIAETTLQNISEHESGRPLTNEISLAAVNYL